jgi:hypothetical protein
VPKRPLSNRFVDNGDGTTSMYFVDRDKVVDTVNVVTIDTADVEMVSQYVWVYHQNSVYTNLKDYSSMLLSKFLTGMGKTNRAVFLNGNRMDFRRSNVVIGVEGRKKHKYKKFIEKKEAIERRKAEKKIVKVLSDYFRTKARICPTCGRLFPLDEAHWYRNRSTKDGFSASCRECEVNAKRDKFGYLPMKHENDYIHTGNGETLIVLEDKNHRKVGYAKIDTLMYAKCKTEKWHLTGRSRNNGHRGNTEYVCNTNGVPLHRFILGEPAEGYVIDHINRDGLDNRVCNLRFATFSQNNMNKGVPKNNTSGCTGVGWHKTEGKWRARIKINGKSIELGHFVQKKDAIKARKQAEMKYFGEFRDKVEVI